MKNPSAFSDELRERLSRGKYTQWAAGLSEAHLEALLWMIGEFGIRSSPAPDADLADLQLRMVSDELVWPLRHPRQWVALDAVTRFVQGEPIDLEEAKRRIRPNAP